MEITERAAKYIFRSVITICITVVVCMAIYAVSHRYHSFAGKGNEYHSKAYLVDTWTGETWFIVDRNMMRTN
jgi:hypothetical protein